MNKQEIISTIKDLKDGLSSTFTPAQFKPRMEDKIKELEAKLAKLEPVGKTFKEELSRQTKTGEAKEGAISLLAMSKKMETPEPTKFKKNPFNKFADAAKERATAEYNAKKERLKAAEKKKSVPVKKSERDEYNCDELIDKAIERKKKAKERSQLPKKAEVTKNKEKIDKVITNVKERAESDDISMSELQKLIEETEQLLNLLKNRLSKLK
jgi:hypothetical protein